MKNWWSVKSNKKHVLKLSQLKLELGLFGATIDIANDKVAIEIIGLASKKEQAIKILSPPPFSPFSPLSSLVPFHRNSKRPCTHTTSCRRFLSAKVPSLVWDTRDLCGFNLVLKDWFLGSCDMSFHVLYGEGGVGESKGKMRVIGKVSLTVDMAELLLVTEEGNCEHDIQRKVPIRLKVNGLLIEATLSVSLRLLKLRDCNDESQEAFEKRTMKSNKKHEIKGKVKYLTCMPKKHNGKFNEGESPYESDESHVFDSDESSNESTTSSGSSTSNTSGIYNTKSKLMVPTSETMPHLGTLQRSWSQFSRNRSFKGWNFNTNTLKQATLTTTHQPPFTKLGELSSQSCLESETSRWEIKEISSRDGQAKLKTNVFFASFDQRSEKASGNSACTVLVALIAHWLHSNQGMPTRAQFDNLITQGSLEWRKLCNNDHYSKLFPDKHFDLETILETNLRPLIVLHHKSYTGFFSPEKFQCLKGAMSFDEIWEEINNKVVDNYESRIYIVSWNDHFFVLKVEVDAYYIIDSLGERLFEGCQRGFILKFDDSCVMYEKVDEVGKSPLKENNGVKNVAKGEERLEIVCRGKVCCKEFIKRFLAAIPLRQLEKEEDVEDVEDVEDEEKAWTTSNLNLYRQLQIDFHFSSSTSADSSLLSFLSSDTKNLTT